MADHSMMKLGKRAPKTDAKRLKLSKYLLPSLPPPPDSIDWSDGNTSWGMMGNDVLGDCTCAALGHAKQVWTINTTGLVTPADSDVIALYEGACGYVPGDPATDQGGVEVDVLNYVRTNGLFGTQLIAYVDPDPGNEIHIKQAVSLFGGVYIGLALPLTAQNQDIWDVSGNPQTDSGSQPGSWGGHAVWVVAYNSTGPVCITWGILKQMTWAFWNTYCDESHALYDNTWNAEFGGNPGIDQAALQADLEALNS